MSFLFLLMWCGLTYYNYNNYTQTKNTMSLFMTGFCAMGLLNNFLGFLF